MRILVADRNLVPHRARFEAALPADVTVVWGGEQALRTAEVFVGGRFTAEMATVAEKLRLVHVAGAGTDRVDFTALSPDVQVANTFHHERSIAEYVLSAAIMLRRDFLAQDRALRRDVWATPVYDDVLPQLPTLGAARIGFVGFGHIGRRCWELLRALGCTGAAVTGTGRVDPACGLDWAATTASLDRLMAESEVVVVSAPLTADTTGMIGSAQLRALGPDGVLINVGRGPLVDEPSLYEALLHKEIRAAAIDVWYRYPAPGTGGGTPAELPFHELANILMTPHSSGVTSDTFAGRADDIAANIGRLYRAEPLLNVVSQRAS